MSTNSFNHARLSRRAVLGGTLGAAALALAGCSRASNDPDALQTAGGGNDKFDVIVVGAGSAGVAAARYLKDAGKSVVVLEARNRTGGRLWTDRSIMTVPHERGASLVHGGPDTSTWPWAQKVGLKARKFEQTLSRYKADSPWVPWGNPEFYSFPEGTPKIGLPLPEPKQTETAELYLQELGIGPSNYPLALLGVQVDTEQFNKLPAANIVDTLSECFTVLKSGKVQPSDYAGDYKLLGAYDQIINAVADGLDIRLETVVDTIDYSTNGVTVQSGSQTFEATKCIMAVPIGVLQNERITFSQGLEPDRLKAIAHIKQTVAFKTILEFDHPVRPQAFDMVNSHDKGPCQFWDESTGMPDYKGQLIVAWDTGDRARELLALPEPERFSATLEGVRRIAGDSGLNYVNASNYDWRQDQFAFGAYATGEKYLDVMYKPTSDTIFWAGAVMSTVAKAHDSGVEAAKATLKSM